MSWLPLLPKTALLKGSKQPCGNNPNSPPSRISPSLPFPKAALWWSSWFTKWVWGVWMGRCRFLHLTNPHREPFPLGCHFPLVTSRPFLGFLCISTRSPWCPNTPASISLIDKNKLAKKKPKEGSGRHEGKTQGNLFAWKLCCSCGYLCFHSSIEAETLSCNVFHDHLNHKTSACVLWFCEGDWFQESHCTTTDWAWPYWVRCISRTVDFYRVLCITGNHATSHLGFVIFLFHDGRPNAL